MCGNVTCQSKILHVIENFEGAKIETLKTVIFDHQYSSITTVFTSSFFCVSTQNTQTYMQLEPLIKWFGAMIFLDMRP